MRDDGSLDEGHNTKIEMLKFRYILEVRADRLTDGLSMGNERLFNL